MFYVHNDLVNIHTHIFGLFVLMGMNVYHFLPQSDCLRSGVTACKNNYPDTDQAIVALFFVTGMICMGLSSLYHTLNCYSNNARVVTVKLDIVGINIFVWYVAGGIDSSHFHLLSTYTANSGSVIPITYYCFVDQNPTYMIAHMGVSAFFTLISVGMLYL